MAITKPQIDPYLVEWWFVEFKKFVEEKSNIAFDSFASNPYTDKHEGYKSFRHTQIRSPGASTRHPLPTHNRINQGETRSARSQIRGDPPWPSA
jgi:hypothetical protein